MKKFGTIISSADELEKQLRTKRGDSKYDLRSKLKMHFKKIGFKETIIEILMDNMDESKWPSFIRSEKSRSSNRHFIENYSNY